MRHKQKLPKGSAYRVTANFQHSVFLKSLTAINLEFTKWYLSPCHSLLKTSSLFHHTKDAKATW